MRPFLAFDIEIGAEFDMSAVRDDWSDMPHLAVTCVGFLAATGPDCEIEQSWSVCGPEMMDGRYAPELGEQGLRDVLQTMRNYVGAGYEIVGWNSLGFDLRAMHHDAPSAELRDLVKKMAAPHIDPMYQFFCENGFAVSLERAALGMGFEGKHEGIKGAKAPELWRGPREEQERCLAYVAQDARMTAQVYRATVGRGRMDWLTKAGAHRVWSPACKRGDGGAGHRERLLTCAECGSLPVPDCSWLRDPWPRSKFAGWAGLETGKIA